MNDNTRRFLTWRVHGAFVTTVALLLSGCSSPARPASSPERSSASAAASSGPIVTRLKVTAAARDSYPTIAQLNRSKSVDLVVVGEVTSVNDVFWGTDVFRELKIRVDRSFRGRPVSSVTVYERGGIVSLREMVSREGTAHGDPGYTQEQLDHGMVDVQFENSVHTEIGDNVVMYLVRNPNPGYEDTYFVAGGPQGTLRLDSRSETYARSLSPRAVASGFEDRVRKDALYKALQELP